MYGDNYCDEWSNEFEDSSFGDGTSSQASTATPSNTATQIRDSMKDYLAYQ